MPRHCLCSARLVAYVCGRAWVLHALRRVAMEAFARKRKRSATTTLPPRPCRGCPRRRRAARIYPHTHTHGALPPPLPAGVRTENDLLTPSLKIKRPQAQKKYEPQIAAMYAQLRLVAAGR